MKSHKHLVLIKHYLARRLFWVIRLIVISFPIQLCERVNLRKSMSRPAICKLRQANVCSCELSQASFCAAYTSYSQLSNSESFWTMSFQCNAKIVDVEQLCGDVPYNKFEANNDAATSSFVSSFFHLARYFVLVIDLLWSFFCMVVLSFDRLFVRW